MEGKFTRGPWRVGVQKGFNASNVYVDDGKEFPDAICMVYGVPLHKKVDEVERLDNEVYQDALANARLIAAAPDLLDACERALAHLMVLYSNHDEFYYLRDAIAKARGEA